MWTLVKPKVAWEFVEGLRNKGRSHTIGLGRRAREEGSCMNLHTDHYILLMYCECSECGGHLSAWWTTSMG